MLCARQTAWCRHPVWCRHPKSEELPCEIAVHGNTVTIALEQKVEVINALTGECCYRIPLDKNYVMLSANMQTATVHDGRWSTRVRCVDGSDIVLGGRCCAMADDGRWIVLDEDGQYTLYESQTGRVLKNASRAALRVAHFVVRQLRGGGVERHGCGDARLVYLVRLSRLDYDVNHNVDHNRNHSVHRWTGSRSRHPRREHGGDPGRCLLCAAARARGRDTGWWSCVRRDHDPSNRAGR